MLHLHFDTFAPELPLAGVGPAEPKTSYQHTRYGQQPQCLDEGDLFRAKDRRYSYIPDILESVRPDQKNVNRSSILSRPDTFGSLLCHLFLFEIILRYQTSQLLHGETPQQRIFCAKVMYLH
jgi:hypothetical protein